MSFLRIERAPPCQFVIRLAGGRGKRRCYGVARPGSIYCDLHIAEVAKAERIKAQMIGRDYERTR